LSDEVKVPFSIIPKLGCDEKDIPTFVRKGNGTRRVQPEVIKVGTIIDTCFNDNGEYDTPTFLRRQAE